MAGLSTPELVPGFWAKPVGLSEQEAASKASAAAAIPRRRSRAMAKEAEARLRAGLMRQGPGLVPEQ
jgi:hypothetical protein